MPAVEKVTIVVVISYTGCFIFNVHLQKLKKLRGKKNVKWKSCGTFSAFSITLRNCSYTETIWIYLEKLKS